MPIIVFEKDTYVLQKKKTRIVTLKKWGAKTRTLNEYVRKFWVPIIVKIITAQIHFTPKIFSEKDLNLRTFLFSFFFQDRRNRKVNVATLSV